MGIINEKLRSSLCTGVTGVFMLFYMHHLLSENEIALSFSFSPSAFFSLWSEQTNHMWKLNWISCRRLVLMWTAIKLVLSCHTLLRALWFPRCRKCRQNQWIPTVCMSLCEWVAQFCQSFMNSIDYTSFLIIKIELNKRERASYTSQSWSKIVEHLTSWPKS